MVSKRDRRTKRWAHPDGQPLSGLVVGSHVSGLVTKVTKDKVFVDFGAQRDGTLPSGPRESHLNPHDLVNGLQVVAVDLSRDEVELAFSSIALDVLFFSGERLALINAVSSWTGADVKFALKEYLQRGKFVTKLVFGTKLFENTMTISELGLVSGSMLQVVVNVSDYLVEEAGVPEVNGYYKRTGELMEGAPSYVNETGVLLFRYVFPNGVHYWYFSTRSQDVTKKAGDFYRVKTELLHPPIGSAEWGIYNVQNGRLECPLGDGCFPVVSKVCGEADEQMAV